MFRDGMEPDTIIERYSEKSYYKFRRLWILIQLRDRIQFLIDSENWKSVPLPDAKRVLREVRNW